MRPGSEMRKITKRIEPKDSGLAEWRKTPGAEWNGGQLSDTGREALRSDQSGLCAYCMTPIQQVKVEHFIPRHHGVQVHFDWNNLLAVCQGDAGGPKDDSRFHCDARRGNLTKTDQDLPLNPIEHPNIATVFKYTSSGDIGPANTTDADKVQEMISKLNLQAGRFLRDNRAAAYRAAQYQVRQLKGVTAGKIRNLLARARSANPTGSITAFAGVVEYYLEKKLRQM